MTIVETAKVTSKGQVTIPNQVRKMLCLESGDSVGFAVTKDGIVLVPCEVTAKSPYTTKEWTKIEHMVAEKGATFGSAGKAKKFLDDL